MHDFRYVPKKEVKPVRNELFLILREVQDLVRDDFTFQFKLIGSSSRNMLTYDAKSNIGYDFDINIEVNDDEEQFTPKEIRLILKNAIDRVAPKYSYNYCEDSTRVLTIKKVNIISSRIIHSCDFAVVYNCSDGRQQYIRYNKTYRNYTWEYQGKGFEKMDAKIEWLKGKGYWAELRAYYIEKKNFNDDRDKHSRSIFVESINEICHKKGLNKIVI